MSAEGTADCVFTHAYEDRGIRFPFTVHGHQLDGVQQRLETEKVQGFGFKEIAFNYKMEAREFSVAQPVADGGFAVVDLLGENGIVM